MHSKVVPTKRCPRCGGTGRVARHVNREIAVEASREWADSLNAQVVKISPMRGAPYFGVAVATRIQGVS